MKAFDSDQAMDYGILPFEDGDPRQYQKVKINFPMLPAGTKVIFGFLRVWNGTLLVEAKNCGKISLAAVKII